MRWRLLLVLLTVAPGLAQVAPLASPRPAPSAAPAARPAPRKVFPRRPKLAALDERVVKQVVEMLTAYERRSVLGMRRFISGGFRSRDDLGFGQSPNQVELSFGGDFRNLRDIDFDVVINPPEYSADFRQARVDLQFNRRARFAVSGQEWIVRSQRTTLNFDIGGPTTRVGAVQGAPIMGLTNAVGVLVVDRGTVDGVPITTPQPVLNGRLGQGGQDLFGFGNFRRLASPVGLILPPTVAPVVAPPAPPPTVVAPPPPTVAPVLLPDIVITGADIVYASGEPPSAVFTTNGGIIRVTVHNNGNAAAGAFNVQVTYRNATTNNSATQTFAVPGLPAGQTFTSNNLLFLVGATQGANVVITAIGDVNNAVAESNEANNTGVRNVTIGP